MNFRIVGVTLFGILCFTSCKTKQEVVNQQEQMAFYTLEAAKDTVLNKTFFSVKTIQVVNSKLKKINDRHYEKEPNYLEVSIKDQNKHTIKLYTEHPLYKRFDLYEESGEIQSKSISLQQGEVTFRVPYYAKYKRIKIKETVNFKTQNAITIKNEK